MSPTKIDEFLQRIPKMTDSACVPVPVAAAHDGVSERTVWRRYELVKLAPGRTAVRVSYLRSRRNNAAA